MGCSSTWVSIQNKFLQFFREPVSVDLEMAISTHTQKKTEERGHGSIEELVIALKSFSVEASDKFEFMESRNAIESTVFNMFDCVGT